MIQAPRITINYTHLLKYGQIGESVHLPTLEQRIQGFLSSKQGIRFILRSVLALTGKTWGDAESISVDIFQQGFFQFVMRIQAQNNQGETANFCVIMSKGIRNGMMDTDKLTIDEFNNLKKYNSLYPDLFVQPLILFQDEATQLVLYSSRLYTEQLELDYKIDGVAGRKGLFINSPKVPNGCLPINTEDQDPLLEEMVKILAVAYDENTGEAVEGLKVSAGDFIVDFKDKDRFSMRLVPVRLTTIRDIPTFICSLTNYFLGLQGSPLTRQITHVGFIFNETTVYNGLVKAFMYKDKLSREEANRKAAAWMAEYHREGETGKLDSYLRYLEMLREKSGLEALPRHYHCIKE